MNMLKQKLKDINTNVPVEIEYASFDDVIELLYDYEEYHTIRHIYECIDKITEDIRRKRGQ